MAEFGERLKALREERGMTQQTLAEHLYVTRQAVSRWECGARYPDLLMAKRIADFMGVSMDELVSGEEVTREVEKEKVLNAPLAGAVQTMLYAVAVVSWFFITFLTFVIGGWAQKEGTMTLYSFLTATIANVLFLGMLGAGLYWSIMGKLSPKKVAAVMSSVFFITLCSNLVNGIVVGQKSNVGFVSYFAGAILYALVAWAVYSFFTAKRRVTPIWVYLIAALYMVNMLLLPFRLDYGTEEFDYEQLAVVIVFLIRIVFSLVFGALLIYQACMLDRKRRAIRTQQENQEAA